MKITKEVVLAALSHISFPDEDKNIVEIGSIKNINIFGTDIELDIEIKNPTLQYKKKVEYSCVKAIHDHVFKKSKVKVHFNLNTSVNTKKIKGKSIAGVKNIIAVSSAKGGVGKSTIAANLAVGLSNLGHKVGLIDADIYGPSIHIMFGLQGETPSAIEIGGESKIKPLENYGVKLLSIGFFGQAQQAVVWRGPMASKALNQLLWDAHWGELDYLIVDLPPGTGDIHLSLVQSIPLTGVVVVSTPQNIALSDVKKGINMFQMDSIDVPILGIIENMAYFTPEELPNNKYYIFGKQGAQALAEKIKIDLLAEVPIVQSLRESADAGRPAVLQGSTPIAVELLKMSRNVVAAINKRNLTLAATKPVELTHSKGCSS